MVHDVWFALLLALQYIGVVALAYALTLRLLRTEKGTLTFFVLPVLPSDDAQERLYARHLRRELLGERERSVIIALDMGLPPRQKRELLRFCNSVPRMFCCTAQELPGLIEQVQNDLRT